MTAVRFALDAAGRDVTLDLSALSTLVAGLPGAGKSTTLRSILAGAALHRSIALVLLDPKRVELPAWSPRSTLVAVDSDDCTAALRSVVELIEARYALLEHEQAVLWTPSHERPLVVVVVDELAELLDTGDPADKDRARLLRRILSKGRAAGVVVIAATQRPSAEVVPTFVRDLFAYRLAHASATREATEMVLGPAWQLGPAHELPLGRDGAGLAYALLEGERQPRLIRSLWLSPADARRHATATAPHRPPLTLCARTQGSEPLPPVQAWQPPLDVLTALQGGSVTAPTIARATGLADTTVRRELQDLERAGVARRLNGSTWTAA